MLEVNRRPIKCWAVLFFAYKIDRMSVLWYDGGRKIAKGLWYMPFIILVIIIVWLVSIVSKSKKKKKLLELQNIVCEDKYNRLMMTEK